MSSIIKVENLSKQYRLGEISTGAISHDINRWWHKIRGKENPYLKIGDANDRATKGESEYVWSLRDINFEIQQGDAVGIIGRNGAGKSTLLKILSKVTQPTTGTIKTKGRIASLLEVGTGFHPELSGRDNIYLNGAILGMRKAEIARKFDEIVDFSGVERYINTPVKRYSSGMYVRLAFAVATYLESEILIVDEVLAVGDAEFQKKCLGKMNDVSKNEGRTVLFVSHQMGTISQLCESSILLHNGKMIKSGKTENVVNFYLQSNSDNNEGYEAKHALKEINIVNAYTLNEHAERITIFTHDSKIQIITRLVVNSWVDGSEFRLVLKDVSGKAVFTSDLALNKKMILNDQIIINADIPKNFLRPGNYVVTLATFVPHQVIIDLLEDILPIKVVDGGSKYAASEGLDYGYIFFEPIWTIN